MRLALASAFTLSLLSSFLLVVLAALGYMLGAFDFTFLVLFVIVLNFLIWLISPKISDFTYRYFYDMEWITIEELREKSPESAEVIEKVTEKYDYNQPKLGIIKDSNPNAFTYGSGRWNGRIIVSEGLFEYCDDKEAAAVYAHELGHITNRDFIIMTVANTIVQLLYIVAIRAYRMAATQGGNRDKAGAALIGLAIISYIFYYIGQYVVLYLSRVREYYADKFAAKHTNPNHMSSALIKVAYGIMAEPNDKELVKATKNIGLMNFEKAEDTGALYYNCENLDDFEPLNKALLYDLKNPWAKIKEIQSTHPLTGNRIEALMQQTQDPMFNFQEIREKYTVDTKRLYKQFAKDLSILGLPKLTAVTYPVIYGTAILLNLAPISWFYLLGGWILLTGIAKTIQALYKYPRGQEAEEKTVIELMSDIYASPVRGNKIKLNGEIIGKGQAGYKFSEDVMFKDDTGIMFIKYESWMPVIGNFLFAINKVPELVDQKVQMKGWFLRGNMPWVGMKTLTPEDGETIKGYIHIISIFGGAITTLIGLALLIAGLLL